MNGKKMMTALTLVALLVCGVFQGQAFAKEGTSREKPQKITIRGTVEHIDLAGKSITVVDKEGVKHQIAVNPRSEFEIDYGELRDDVDATLADLKQGDRVKAKALSGKKRGLRLKEMDIYR